MALKGKCCSCRAELDEGFVLTNINAGLYTCPKCIQPAQQATTQGLGRIIYGIELEDLYIMAALVGVAQRKRESFSPKLIAGEAVELGQATYKLRMEQKHGDIHRSEPQRQDNKSSQS